MIIQTGIFQDIVICDICYNFTEKLSNEKFLKILTRIA